MPKKIISLDELSRFKDNLDLILEDKANVDGNYPTMHVGLADDLYYKGGQGSLQTKPFIFQATGTDSNTSIVQIGNFASFRSLRGNSVAFNQLAKVQATQTVNGITLTDNGNGTKTISGTATSGVNALISQNVDTYKDHWYLVSFRGYDKQGQYGVSYYISSFGGAIENQDAHIYKATSTTQRAIRIVVENGATIPTMTITPQIFDLTLMFGAGNEPTSVVEFNTLFPKPYYEYNAGTLLSCKANGIKNVGYNQLSLNRTAGTIPAEEWRNTEPRVFEENKYYAGLKANNYYSNQIGTVDNISSNSITITGSGGYGCGIPVKVIACQTYTLSFEKNGTGTQTMAVVSWYDKGGNFLYYSEQLNSTTVTAQAPNNAYWCVIMFRPNGTLTYYNVAFHLTWDGSRTGYEEYHSETYQLPNVELRSASSAYDEILPTGKLIRRIGVVDLGTLNWQVSGLSTETNHIWYVNNFDGKVRTPNLLCVKYAYVEESLYSTTPNTVCVLDDNSLRVNTGSSSSTPTGLLFYELDTPTEEQVAPYQQIQPIDDFGTQEFLYDSNIDIPIPQGYEAYYPANYTALVDQLYRHTDGDAYKLVLETELNAKVLNFMTAISGYDSTKTQTLKNVSGVLTWVDDE